MSDPPTSMIEFQRSALSLGRPTDGERASEEESSLTPSAVLHMVGRWWRSATLCGLLLAGGIGGYFWNQFRPIYRASAWLQISARPQFLAFADPDTATDGFIVTQVALIRSPLVMDPVARRPDIAELAVLRGDPAPGERLCKEVKVEQLDRSELVQISLASTDRNAATRIVNAVCDVYYNLCSTDNSRRTQRMIELLEADKHSRAARVEELRAKVRQWAQQNPALVAESKSDGAYQNSISAIQNRLISIELEREILEAQAEADRELLASGNVLISSEEVGRAVQDLPQYRKLELLLSDREVELSEAEAISARGQADPYLRRLTREVETYRDRLADVEAQLRPKVAERLRAQRTQQHEQNLARTERSIAEHRKLEQRLTAQLKSQLAAKQSPGPSAVDFSFAKAELARAESIVEQVSQRAESLRTEIHAPPRVSVLRPAKVPVVPQPVSYTKMAALTLGGFMLPFVCVVLLETKKRRIGEAHQMAQDAKLAIVGETALMPSRPFNPAVRLSRRAEKQRRIFDESIDSIRTRLWLAEGSKDVQVLAVASAVSGEGKTRLASHLAVSLARTLTDQVLLIDADLRAPEVHELFEVSNETGLVDVLDRRASVDEAIVTSWRDNLHVLPAGRLTKNPYMLLGSDEFPQLLNALRGIYRHIIIDAPPLLAASDALIIAKAADGTLLCALRDVSRSPQVKLAYERLISAGARPIGAVLNGVPARRYEYMYGVYNYSNYAASETPDATTFQPLFQEASAATSNGRRPK